MKKLWGELEKDLSFVGVTAVEDLLQDQVPETLSMLKKMDIKFWVMTGDKKETLLEVSRLANIYDQSNTDIVDVEGTDPEKLLYTLKEALGMYPLEDRELLVIIDGKTLEAVLSYDYLDDIYFKLCHKASAVLCCRVTPSKKAKVVSILKHKTKQSILTIGDGSNDVPMIIEGDIGISIRSFESTQAVRVSDFSIPFFKNL